MSWLIPPKPHPLLLFSPFSLLFSFIYITHSNPPLPLLLPSVPLLLCLLSLCYYPPFLCYPVSSYPVTTPVLMLPCLLFSCYYPLFLCYPVFSSSVTTLCSFVTLSPFTLSPLFSSSVTTPCSFVTLSPFTLSPYILSCKECLPVLSTGAFTLSKARPFKHAEHAFLAPWRRPSCPLNMPFL